MSALGLDVHGKDSEPISDEEQSSDDESEVSDAGSEARAGRRARVRRAEDEDEDDTKDQPDELEPWVDPEEKAGGDSWAINGGSAWDEKDTSGWDNQPTAAKVNAGDPVAAPSTSQPNTGGADAPTQTSKPPRSKADKAKGEKKEKKDKKEGSSKPKQQKPKTPKPKPKPAVEGNKAEVPKAEAPKTEVAKVEVAKVNEAAVAEVDEGDSKGKEKRSGGYVNHERVKTGGSERTKLTDDELAARMERIRVQNEKIKEKRQEVINDEEEFNKISADDIDVRQRKEHQARLQAEVDRERQKVAQRKLAQLQNRAWDAGKKGPAEQGIAPPRADNNAFWGTPKVEANGDIRSAPSGEAEGATEATSPGGVERGRGRGRGFRGGDRGSGRGRGEGGRGRGRGRGGPSRTHSSHENPPKGNESKTKPAADAITAAPSQVEGKIVAE